MKLRSSVMGFNLEMFFDELEELLEADIDDVTRCIRLKLLVLEERDYAKECGLIK